jgi:hypothetical protein
MTSEPGKGKHFHLRLAFTISDGSCLMEKARSRADGRHVWGRPLPCLAETLIII